MSSENLKITDSTRICAKHFHEVNLATTISSRKRKEKINCFVQVKRFRLKLSAIPKLFTNLLNIDLRMHGLSAQRQLLQDK